MKFVVTGTGRCGTGYVSKLLSESGLRTGHEQVFTPNGFQGSNMFYGDSSWLAAPLLSDYLDLHVIHLKRDRQKVIDSFKRIGFFDPNRNHGRYRDFVRKHTPEVRTPEEHYDRWNSIIAPYSDAAWQVEEIDEEMIVELFDAIGFAIDIKKIRNSLEMTPKDTNTR